MVRCTWHEHPVECEEHPCRVTWATNQQDAAPQLFRLQRNYRQHGEYGMHACREAQRVAVRCLSSVAAACRMVQWRLIQHPSPPMPAMLRPMPRWLHLHVRRCKIYSALVCLVKWNRMALEGARVPSRSEVHCGGVVLWCGGVVSGQHAVVARCCGVAVLRCCGGVVSGRYGCHCRHGQDGRHVRP